MQYKCEISTSSYAAVNGDVHHLLFSKPALGWGLESASLGFTLATAAAHERCKKDDQISPSGAGLLVRVHHGCREQSTRCEV